MKKVIISFLALSFLSGCAMDAGGNWNPINWFGGSDEPELVEYEEIDLDIEEIDDEIQ